MYAVTTLGGNYVRYIIADNLKPDDFAVKLTQYKAEAARFSSVRTAQIALAWAVHPTGAVT
jgi:hypothetical protein